MKKISKSKSPPKKSFLLYCDQSRLIEKLTDEQAGILIKTVFSYCCSTMSKPKIDDQLVDIVFTSMQTSLDRDYKKYLKIVKRNRDNGQLGGRPKKPSGLSGNPKNPSEPDSDSDSDSDNEKSIYTPNFISFWRKYPRKIGKGKAFQNYKNIKEPKPGLKIVLEAIKIQNKSEQWQDKKYIPHPATWISQRRWEDEIEPLNGTKTKEEMLKEMGL